MESRTTDLVELPMGGVPVSLDPPAVVLVLKCNVHYCYKVIKTYISERLCLVTIFQLNSIIPVIFWPDHPSTASTLPGTFCSEFLGGRSLVGGPR